MTCAIGFCGFPCPSTDKPDFPNYGAFHTAEVPFAFRNLNRWERPWKETDFAVERYMSSYWINFIRNGDPNGPNLPQWKSYSADTGYIMELSDKPVLREGLFQAEFAFLEGN
jgi:para-nitrobenzyl esterase